MKKLSYAEIGILIGFFLGLLLFLIAWFFSKTANANVCLFSVGETSVCVRYISTYPAVFAGLGLIIGLIAGRVKKP